MSSSENAPPSNPMNTMTEQVTLHQNGKPNTQIKWPQHVKTFYKSTRQYGFNHADTLKQVSSLYRSGR